MIYLPDVASKLEEILNNSNISNLSNPNGYFYKVATTGFHLDKNYDREAGRNFIPVFIDTMGGNYDAVKQVKRAVKTITVAIYFPVRFKEDMFAMDEFLVDTFVAQTIDFGGITGSALCNISTTQYGEIVDLDLKQFIDFVSTFYGKTISVMEPYMSMAFTLYITSQADGFLLGNAVSYELTYSVVVGHIPHTIYNGTEIVGFQRYDAYDRKIDGVQYYCWKRTLIGIEHNYVYTTRLEVEVGDNLYEITLEEVVVYGQVGSVSSDYDEETQTYSEDLVWTSSGTGLSNSPISQQLIDEDSFAKNVINITNYNKSIMAYVRNTDFWMVLLDYYNRQEMKQLSTVSLVKTYNFGTSTKSYTYNQLVLSLNENVSLGDLISFTITFGDNAEESE